MALCVLISILAFRQYLYGKTENFYSRHQKQIRKQLENSIWTEVGYISHLRNTSHASAIVIVDRSHRPYR
jgi:hypothetical protein